MRFISRLKRILRRTFHQLVNPTPERLLRKRQVAKKRSIPVYANRPNKVILSMVNYERRKHHLAPIKFDQDLENHAIRWSKHMAHQRSLSHSGTILENCCTVPNTGSSTSIAKSMFSTWRSSKPHWKWMMDPEIRFAALGYTISGKQVYGAYAFR